MDKNQRQQEIQRSNWIGIGADLLLTILKLLFGTLGNSQGLLADGFHSLSDVATDFMVLFAAQHGHEAPDADHPYGHARIETATSVATGVIVLLVGCGLIWDATSRLFEPSLLKIPGTSTIWVAILSLLVKEGLYHYNIAIAQRHRSALLRANAWNHRSDGISTLVVLLGVLGARTGLHYLDAISAIFVGVLIIQVAWELSWEPLRELIDTGVAQEQLTAIRSAILDTDGVKALHLLRTRHMGTDILVDVHILLRNSMISVSEGHQVSEIVRRKLTREIENVTDVTVHIDSEDDEREQSCVHLPLRTEILRTLDNLWRDLEFDRTRREITLHYLDGKIHVDVVFPLTVLAGELTASSAIASLLTAAVHSEPLLGNIRVRFE